MHVLWRLPQATVAEVRRALQDRPRLAYNTVLTTLRILEQKGYVTHMREGRAFVYAARVAEHEARRRAIHHLISRFFDDSPRELVRILLGGDVVDAAEVESIRRLVAQSA